MNSEKYLKVNNDYTKNFIHKHFDQALTSLHGAHFSTEYLLECNKMMLSPWR